MFFRICFKSFDFCYNRCAVESVDARLLLQTQGEIDKTKLPMLADFLATARLRWGRPRYSSSTYAETVQPSASSLAETPTAK